MHIEILSKDQSEILPWLKPFSRKFYLAGGTAIALHLGHRHSFDFEFYCAESFTKKYISTQLKSIPFEIILPHEDDDHEDVFHLKVNGVKVSFYHFPFHITHFLKINDILMIPELKSLTLINAFNLEQKSSWHEFVDMYFILKEHFTLSQIVEESNKNFENHNIEKQFREHLAFHSDINYDEPIEFLVEAPSEDEIKQFLIDKALDISQ